MKKLPGPLAALFLFCTLIVGCGGSGGTNLAVSREALQGCTESSVRRMLQVFDGLIGVPDALSGEPTIPGFSVEVTLSQDPGDPPLTYDFSVVFDTTGNALPDTALVGKVTFSEDPTPGIAEFAMAQFDFSVQNTPPIAGAVFEMGTLNGSGSIAVVFGAVVNEVTITGSLSLADTAGDGCAADLLFPAETPLNLGFGPQIAANLVSFEIFGTIQAALESLGHRLDETLTLTQGDRTVDGQGSFDGTAEFDFSFDLVPPDADVQQLIDCAASVSDQFKSLLGLSRDVVESGVLTGRAPPPGVIVVVTTDPDTFGYTADLALLDPGTFAAGTVSGQVTVDRTVPDVAFTWGMDGTLMTNPPTTLLGASTRALRVRLDERGNVLSFSGAGTFDLSGATGCSVSIAVPDDAPLLESGASGTEILTVNAGGNVMTVTIDFREQTVAAVINGIPFPLDVF